MNAFDKLCAAVAFLVGIIFLGLGVFGLFAGIRAHFSLPPVLGVIPVFVGWGIVRAVYIAWNQPTASDQLSDPDQPSTLDQWESDDPDPPTDSDRM